MMKMKVIIQLLKVLGLTTNLGRFRFNELVLSPKE